MQRSFGHFLAHEIREYPETHKRDTERSPYHTHREGGPTMDIFVADTFYVRGTQTSRYKEENEMQKV